MNSVGIETVIISYLMEYGSTRESDLINYLMKECHCSDRQIKKLIETLEKKGDIFRIVHDKLKPPGIYISLNPKADFSKFDYAQLPKTWKAIDEALATEIKKSEDKPEVRK